MVNAEIREFNETDWRLLGGAEKFSDGHEPFVVDNFPYVDMIMAADKNGIQVIKDQEEFILPTADPIKADNYHLMESVFECVVDSFFMLEDWEVDEFLCGFGFRLICK